MASDTPNYAEMDDAQLDALDLGLTDDLLADTPVEAPAQAEPEAKPDPEKVEEGDKPDPTPDPEAGEDEGEEPKRKLLPEQKLRQRAQAAEAEAAAVKAELARIQQAQQAQAEQSKHQAEYDRLYDDVGPEAAEAYRQNVIQSQNAQAARAQEAQTRETLLRTTEEAFRVALPEGEYDALAQKVVDKYGMEAARLLALKQPNPAAWVVKEGRSIETPAERQAAIAAEAKKLAEAALSKQTDPPKGQKSIGHLSSTRSAGVEKPTREMSDAELDEHEAFLRANW